MIVCPLTLDECNKVIVPSPRTAFIMAPSKQKTTPELRQVIDKVESVLSEHSFDHIEGAELVDYGDYLCSICKSILACPVGIAVSSVDIPADTLSNILWEMGLMQGFGKPVILLAHQRRGLPSDFARHFVIFFKHRGYVNKFGALLESLIAREGYYSDTLGDLAFEAGDYEKAGKYYQDAYLIGEDARTLDKIRRLGDNLREHDGIPAGYKKRLLDGLSTFQREVLRARAKQTA